MKKGFIILLVTLAVIFLLVKHGENVVNKSLNNGELIVFSQEGCGHCHNALAFINSTIKEKYPNLVINIKDVQREKKNMTTLIFVAKKHGLDLTKLGTPVILFNDNVIVGWSSKKEEELLKLLETK